MKARRMKVARLTGAKLDYWVARAEGVEATIQFGHCYLGSEKDFLNEEATPFNPSTNWALGGPIMERERIEEVDMGAYWNAAVPDRSKPYMNGETILEAAMRCYVASKFGEAVCEENAN